MSDRAHLTDAEIADLIGPGTAADLPADRVAHAGSCELCSEKVALYREVDRDLKRIASGPRPAPGPECPSPAVWAELAAGLIEGARRDRLTAHAVDCDACGAVLRAAAEDLLDEVTDAERQQMDELASSGLKWQHQMARRLAAAPRKRPAYLSRWAVAAAGIMIAITGGWFAWMEWAGRMGPLMSDPARLLAAAYTEQRPFAYRIPGAAYAAVSLERGTASSRPLPMAEAEPVIRRALKNNPDSATWLELSARMQMLEHDPETALATLQRALEQQPDDPGLLAGIGMAYALRGDAQNRALDYGYAIDSLQRSLLKRPDVPEVVFNLALVFEKMNSLENSIAMWQRYLQLDRRSAWTGEAQQHLNDLEQKKKSRQTAMDRVSDKSPEPLARALDAGEPVEPEGYLEVAITEWLPRRWENPGYEHALSGLARLLEERHHDRWLRDMLAVSRSDGAARGLRALADAVRANLSDDWESALKNAVQAGEPSRLGASEAATVRAQLEQAVALRRMQKPCREQAAAAEQQAQAHQYSWIRAQAILEEGNCHLNDGDTGAAHEDMANGLAAAREAGYEGLKLRAEGLLVAPGTSTGDLPVAWSLGREGLATYWSGPYSGTRGQQIYGNLVRAARSLGLHQAAYSFAQAEVEALAATNRRSAQAAELATLAGLAVEANRVPEANADVEEAEKQFAALPPSDNDSGYRVLAELTRAEAETADGAPAAALTRLEQIRESAAKARATPVQIRFQGVLADALARSGRAAEAESAYRKAIDLTERSLQSLKGPRQRAELLLLAGGAYRGLVELLWSSGHAAEALTVWEWYREGEWPGQRSKPDLAQRRKQLTDEAFLIFAMLPGGPVVWVLDSRGMESRRLNVKPEDLQAVASRFLWECADQASAMAWIQRDARQLYEWLVAPLAARLASSATLVIEPDGTSGAIPMVALMDENFHYLGERFAITIASGLSDYERRKAARPVTAGVRAVIAADPTLGEEMTRSFPRLGATAREGQSVAARFPDHVLLHEAGVTLQALEQQVPKAELFHFAGHGFSNAGNGGLLLAPGAAWSEGADILDGNRLAQRDWSGCRLAVLAACSAGAGERNGPVNPESLVRGLLWAGVARVVASRWNVEDEKGTRFMDRFYENLLSGADVARALQHSAQFLRARQATQHPYYWAGFQDFGAR